MFEPKAASEQPGLVFTFYSYKGGVGRTMALANVGVLMASEGHRLLLIDWDLEAPGLELYFERSAQLVGNPSETPGIVDLLHAHSQGTPLPWRNCLLRAEFFGQSLDVLPSGRRTDDYRRRVQSLDWETLFREHRVGNYMNSLRDEWRSAYDFVLVDSRTGITDIGDICTVILPDVLIFLFVTNHQSVVGTKDVMARAVNARSKMPVNRSKLLGVPVPARDERDREYDKSIKWQEIFANEFGDLYREWLPKEVNPSDALNRIFIPYVASWSFGEHLPVVESQRERADPTSLGAAYARLATLLSHRLDWSAIEATASEADVVGTRVELSKAREEARKAEMLRRKEEKRQAEELALAREEARKAEMRRLEEETRRRKELLVAKRQRILLAGMVAFLLVAFLLLSAFLFLQAKQARDKFRINPPAEKAKKAQQAPEAVRESPSATETPSPSPVERPTPSPSERALGKKAWPNVSLSPEEIADYDSYSPKVREVIDAGLALTKQNLGYTYGSPDPANNQCKKKQ